MKVNQSKDNLGPVGERKKIGLPGRGSGRLTQTIGVSSLKTKKEKLRNIQEGSLPNGKQVKKEPLE